ncbi:hypothetical protein P153DRAFT_393982 [Dothidotthia symphoricarpi CBS 119687]|uniref:C2H2-type domain-containing protein n=1 Tax=Dothidotthia symphoricarpi CBS 119687 TaxID=1392245 RepID=A0A6A6APD9_9PLEO|nr:uncharacterized protein P153DRAFT_393982 [Dothidotthia symphoricarpi CBS 119687]KAF2133053.1 hypothetical protein P153DRAFT_393982 [Dothidotthia symphoricarpi CBS 119687]
MKPILNNHSRDVSSLSAEFGLPTQSPELRSTYQTMACRQCSSVYRGEWANHNLDRHVKSKHGLDGPKVVRCEILGCGRQFRRGDALLVHRRRHHSHLKIAPPQARRKRYGER